MSYEQIIHSTKYGNYTINIKQDSDPGDPRSWDTLGTMVCWHRRYRLGDKHGFDDPDAFRSEMKRGRHIVLSLFLYEHSGITMSSSPSGQFADRWDSMQVGYIHISKEKACKAYGWKKITASRLDKIKQVLLSEVACYDQYLRGDVYGYVAEDASGAELGSCWGFYGDDWKENGLLDHAISDIKYDISQKDRKIKDQVSKHLERLRRWIKGNVPIIYRRPLTVSI